MSVPIHYQFVPYTCKKTEGTEGTEGRATVFVLPYNII